MEPSLVGILPLCSCLFWSAPGQARFPHSYITSLSSPLQSESFETPQHHILQDINFIMGISKERISSPLEAGPSLNDTKQLPPQLTAALEYVSQRLARKGLHLSLIVVRKDDQIPVSTSPTSTPRSGSPTQSLTASPTRSLFGVTSDLVSRPPSRHSSSASISDSISSASSFSRTKWPGLPSHPKVPATAPSPTTSTCSSPISPRSTPKANGPNPYGISLIHASTLTLKAEKILRQTIAKAEKKFSIG